MEHAKHFNLPLPARLAHTTFEAIGAVKARIANARERTPPSPRTIPQTEDVFIQLPLPMSVVVHDTFTTEILRWKPGMRIPDGTTQDILAPVLTLTDTSSIFETVVPEDFRPLELRNLTTVLESKQLPLPQLV